MSEPVVLVLGFLAVLGCGMILGFVATSFFLGRLLADSGQCPVCDVVHDRQKFCRWRQRKGA